MRQPIRHTHPSVSLRSPSACVSATLAATTLAATFAATLSPLTVSPAAASPALPALPALDATGSPGAGRAAVTLSPGAAAASPGASHAATTASAVAAAGTSPILGPGPVLMPPIRYVALGDSFAALSDLLPTATLPQKPALAPGHPTFWARLLCLNSARNYPRLAAVELGAELRDVSCSSATTDNFRDPQYPGVPPQRDGLRPDTELVTVTLGANDTKIAYLIWGCPLGFVYAPSQQEGCAKLAQKNVQQRLNALPAKLDALIAGIKQASPHAVVILTGYMAALDEGVDCAQTKNMLPGDRAFVMSYQRQLNGAIRQAAVRNHVYSVGTVQEPGHSVCAVPSQRWVGGLGLDTNSYPLHPTYVGQVHMGHLVAAKYREVTK